MTLIQGLDFAYRVILMAAGGCLLTAFYRNKTSGIAVVGMILLITATLIMIAVVILGGTL